ncbi:putative polygalacturonase [Heracleum sosnowskyi]|uniref:Polygalacturonase n=1 Tax=Heracleum sosnowskyi TaxID=360622 RepID=A0AAD8N2Z8_9APIA|nr:putative polygalacturonase [Heracleum sosnowskyi]
MWFSCVVSSGASIYGACATPIYLIVPLQDLHFISEALFTASKQKNGLDMGYISFEYSQVGDNILKKKQITLQMKIVFWLGKKKKFHSFMLISTPISWQRYPNTDGIHLQNSREVLIHNTNLACGDDCMSIQTGCSNVYIHNVNCGPGHGISIGGLGKDNTKACVANITVRDIDMHNTMNSVRIKTWKGGSGSVEGVLFSNIQVSEVRVPIIIDQFYCDKSKCKNQTTTVALSGITYERIRGTYTVKPVHFACSDSLPCTEVTLNTIALKPLQEHYHMYDPVCWRTFGELYSTTVPPINCLETGKPLISKYTFSGALGSILIGRTADMPEAG